MDPGDQYYWSHRVLNEHLVPPVVTQPWPACWSISPTRHLEALLKVRGDLGNEDALSIQEIIDVMPRYRLSRSSRAVRHPDSVKFILKDKGTVLDDGAAPLVFGFAANRKIVDGQAQGRFRPREVFIHDYESYKDNLLGYDRLTEQLLRVCPIAVRIRIINEEYEGLQGFDLYNPPGIDKEDYGHFVLLTGFGVDAQGRRFWEAQDSYGVDHGVSGYIRIARGGRAITDVLQIRL